MLQALLLPTAAPWPTESLDPEEGLSSSNVGCGLVQALSAKADNQGTYVGAVAIKIGDVSIEIVGNNLTTIQGTSQLSYAPDYYNDMAMGPFELAGSTATVIVERESVPTNGLWK